MRAIYAGSFDPVTNGHCDIIQRAARLCDELVVAVLSNPAKVTKFTAQERLDMLQEICKDMPNVTIAAFGGLLVDFAKQQNAKVIIRGVRSAADFEYEMQMAQLNKELDPDIETLFLPSDVGLTHISSSFVKEIADFGGNIGFMVPSTVLNKMFEKNNKL